MALVRVQVRVQPNKNAPRAAIPIEAVLLIVSPVDVIVQVWLKLGLALLLNHALLLARIKNVAVEKHVALDSSVLTALVKKLERADVLEVDFSLYDFLKSSLNLLPLSSKFLN